jgi:arginine N-succinyltransferase
MLLRPVIYEDLNDLEELAVASGTGLLSLPTNRRFLHEKIRRSQFALSVDVVRPKGEEYLFVLEELKTKKIVGCCGIHSKTGGYEPLHAYRIENTRVHSTFVPVDHRVKMLTLERIHNGPSEMCTLFLMPQHRHSGLGQLLSLSRFLFIDLHRIRFEDELMAVMRGYINPDNCSPFWEEVCRPFFKMDFEKANQKRYDDPRFIDDLLPKHPLYVPLLSSEAKKAISRTHPDTVPALNILKGEGFVISHLIDPFDGGPFLSCAVDRVKTIQKRKKAQISKIHQHPLNKPPLISCNHKLDFRACYAALDFPKPGQVALDAQSAQALEVEKGDWISFIPKKSRSS